MGEGITYRSTERGAALVMVLLFTALLLILITSMLTVTGNEIVISGLQRDSVRAMELAQAGLQEAVRRMEAGRPYTQGFTSSLSPNATVTVTRLMVGTAAAYQEIQATGMAGRAQRRLSMLVLQQAISYPPNITFAASVIEQGSAQISCGDAYARTFIQYKDVPSNLCSDGPEPPTISYAGWRISKCTTPDGACSGGGQIPPCYTNAQCTALGQTLWFPSTRHAERASSPLGQELVALTTACPAGGGGSLPPATISGTLADGTAYDGPQFGFDIDDPDDGGLTPPQAVTSKLPCGLPYKLVSATFLKENGTDTVTRLIKKIVFEQWFDNYWTFNESRLIFEKNSSLLTYPRFGSVPPFPDFTTVEGNYDRKISGGGSINSGDFGCKWPEMSGDPNCAMAPANTNRPIIVWMESGSYTINGTLKGHGTVVVDGDLIVNGDFEYWGTMVVNGTLWLGAGNAKIHGGLVADNTLRISGNIEVVGGGSVSSVPLGPSLIIGKAWWER